ncbi:SusC/RagA family TonB-linked outer membrane protein [Desertivirga brevis]|uniref:SusC/RagA family TonB-linked outer membrane protein n=1 Tax=Desertivirga brevis TaxID=2810310 RepID=UPI001A977B65|nr:TonB-dependent receptor [Pedobacter sp. SYSU D00873]
MNRIRPINRFWLLLFFIFPLTVIAQERIVSGKVLDETSQPLPGASVKLKSGTASATTDVTGAFKIRVPEGAATLVVSFIGYVTKEVAVGASSTTLSVSLAPKSNSLDAVVVVGYGTQKRADITGAVAGIKGESLQEVPSANAVAALQGRVAGVDISRNSSRPGAGGQIRIRGNRSLSGTSEPLIVLDGVPFNGSINDINPDDIANIDILKDASSTAIYGFRGSNGVILITTKRGRTGKAQLSYSSYTGFSNVRAQYDMFNGEDFVAFRSAASPAYTAGYSPSELKGIANGTSTNWQDHLYKTGIVTDHNLGISGGSEGVTYSLSSGYYKDQGVITGVGFERYSLNTTIDAIATKRIKVGLSTRNTLSYSNGGGVNPLYATLRITPLASAFNEDGSVNLYPMEGTIDATATMNPLTLSNKDNILDRNRRIRTYNVIYGEVDILKGLKYKINVGLDFRQDNRGTFFGPNTIIRPDATTSAQATASVSNSEAWTALVENLVTYNRVIAKDHRVDFTGLFSIQRDRSAQNAQNSVGYPNEAVQYYNFFMANTVTQVDPGGNGFVRGGLQSYMGRLNYGYKNRYLATFTLRRDGANVFPVNKYLNYPAAALGWNIINENFMKAVPAITNLKLRASYGVTGNPSIPADATRGSLSNNNYNYGPNNVKGYFISGLPNVGLKWESTKQLNLGLDYGFLRDRITGSIEVYRQNTDDLIIQKQLPRSNGATSYWTNAAATKGKGLEFSINTLNIMSSKKGGFTWSSDFNMAMNREEIVRLADATTKQDLGNGWFVGQPVNVIYDFTKLGIWQTSEAVEAASYAGYSATPGQIKIADLNGDMKIDDQDRSVIGTFQPKVTMGMTQRVTYKGFDLSAVAFARLGNKIVAPYLTTDGTGTGYFAFLNGRSNQPKVDYWTPTNPSNAFPRPAGGATSFPYASTLQYYDGSFVKVRSINLGYTLPVNIVSKIGISSLRVYASANNPFILYSPFVKSGLGIDPEGTGTGGTVGTNNVAARNITVGLDLPSTRQFLFGVNAKF